MTTMIMVNSYFFLLSLLLLIVIQLSFSFIVIPFASAFSSPPPTTTLRPLRNQHSNSLISSSLSDPSSISSSNNNRKNDNHDDENYYHDDISHLEQLVYASSLSYLQQEQEQTTTATTSRRMLMNDSSYYDSSSRLVPLVQCLDPISESGVTIFKQKVLDDNNDYDASSTRTGSTIIVAFRGSATPINFSTNLKFNLVPLIITNDDINDNDDSDDQNEQQQEQQQYLIHQGFQDASIGLWKVLQPQLDTVLRKEKEMMVTEEKKKKKQIRLIFTGHSFGGAIAQLCGIQYCDHYNNNNNHHHKTTITTNTNLPPLSGIVTFGGPRLINNHLSKYWNEKYKINSSNKNTDDDSVVLVVVRNYVHNYDPILRQNGPLWDALGFGILGEEVLCEHNQPIVYNTNTNNSNDNKISSSSTDDDTKKSKKKNLPIAWNILDHCYYLGIFVGPRLPTSRL